MFPPPVKVRMRMLMRVLMRILASVVMFYITLHSEFADVDTDADTDADRSILAINHSLLMQSWNQCQYRTHTGFKASIYYI